MAGACGGRGSDGFWVTAVAPTVFEVVVPAVAGSCAEVPAGAPAGFGGELPPGKFRSLACDVAIAEPAEMMTTAAATVPATRIQ